MPSSCKMKNESNSNSNSNGSNSNNNTNTSNSVLTLLSRRGRASPIALSAATSSAVRPSSVTGIHNQQQQPRKRPRTQKLYREDAQHHPSDIALTAANLAAGVLYPSGSNVNANHNNIANSNASHGTASNTGAVEATATTTTATRANAKKAMIGTTAPIHFAKPVFRNANADSVLRRKGVCLESDDEDDENSPHRILLSLSKTPTTSFDDRDGARRRANNSLPYLLNAASTMASTEEQLQSYIASQSSRNHANDENELTTHPSSPPQIQNALRHFGSPGTFCFEPSPTGTMMMHSMNTPTTGTLLEMAPSFSLFNPPSFDSLVGIVGEAGTGGGSNGTLFNLSMDIAQTNSKLMMSPRNSSAATSLYDTNNVNNSFNITSSDNVSDAKVEVGISGQNNNGSNGTADLLRSIEPRTNASAAIPLRSSIANASFQESSTNNISHYPLTPIVSTVDKSCEVPKTLMLGGEGGGDEKSSEVNKVSKALLFGDAEGEHECLSAPVPATLSPPLPSPYQNLPSFYRILLTYRQCFEDFHFLLPGLQQCMSCPYGTFPSLDILTEHDLILCKRQVRSAVCAFGGACLPPNKSINTTNGGTDARKGTTKYESLLIKRFQESDALEGRLSWDLEEDPPIEISSSSNLADQNTNAINGDENEHDDNDAISSSFSTNSSDNMPTVSSFSVQSAHNSRSKSNSNSTPAKPISDVTPNANGSSSSGSKMRYRCKLCGQPKQNHVCPYNQTLQRSIGTQIYPAVNAYTAHEPGELTQSLIEIQAYTNSNMSLTADNVPSLPTTNSDATNSNYPPSTPFTSKVGRIGGSKVKVTPETPLISNSSEISNCRTTLFVEAIDLKPENYRVVTPMRTLSCAKGSDTIKVKSKSNEKQAPFCYPKIPLAYTQRKRLSDFLFSLTKERDGMTDDTAAVLRSGRENDSDYWDVCIAELLTQVIIVLHCSREGSQSKGNGINNNSQESAVDSSHSGNHLLGLRQFLLQVGIAC